MNGLIASLISRAKYSRMPVYPSLRTPRTSLWQKKGYLSLSVTGIFWALLPFPSYAQSNPCSNFWVNPTTNKIECLDVKDNSGRIVPIAPPGDPQIVPTPTPASPRAPQRDFSETEGTEGLIPVGEFGGVVGELLCQTLLETGSLNPRSIAELEESLVNRFRDRYGLQQLQTTLVELDRGLQGSQESPYSIEVLRVALRSIVESEQCSQGFAQQFFPPSPTTSTGVAERDRLDATGQLIPASEVGGVVGEFLCQSVFEADDFNSRSAGNKIFDTLRNRYSSQQVQATSAELINGLRRPYAIEVFQVALRNVVENERCFQIFAKQQLINR